MEIIVKQINKYIIILIKTKFNNNRRSMWMSVPCKCEFQKYNVVVNISCSEYRREYSETNIFPAKLGAMKELDWRRQRK